MIVITGAAGFIASCLIEKLNSKGKQNLVLVDDFSIASKQANWHNKKFAQTINREIFLEWLPRHAENVEFIFHLGARTDTTEFDYEILNHLNLEYSKVVWKLAAKHKIPLVYASSAATYGLGELGYKDEDDLAFLLKPLNPYGESKNDFDKWAIDHDEKPISWKGVKFFNVFGPNEYHKGRMASVVMHTFNQVKETGAMKLFRSHNPNYYDGEQLRDFVYVKDVVDVLWYFYKNHEGNGLFNLGTGKARTFLDLAKATFAAMTVKEDISFIDTPEDIRNKYQYFTQADMSKLRQLGYKKEFYSLENAVDDYVKNYLVAGAIY